MRRFLVYDMRAADGNTGDAAILCIEDSLRIARRETKKCFGEGVIYSYAIKPTGKVDAAGCAIDDLVDERFEELVA